MTVRTRRRACGGVALAVALTGALALPALAAKDDVDLVSRATGGTAADAGSSVPAISADGRFVAFTSGADNLSAEDDNMFVNVFVRDLQAGATTLVSRVPGPAGAGANGDSGSSDPVISADGRLVAFSSSAANLSGEDADPGVDIFVRDLQANTTTLVSRVSGVGGAGADAGAFDPAISADGLVVAFHSGANNLSTEDDDTQVNIFARDLGANTTTLVSRADGPAGAGGDDSSFEPVISRDGRLVAFQSGADNLSLAAVTTVVNVFARDLQANTTTLVSRASGPAGAGGDGSSSDAAISADGRIVGFESMADNLSLDDDNAVTSVFVRDLGANTTALVSRAPGAGGAAADAGSIFPAISAAGRFVAFGSDGDNLSAEDNNGVFNLFVRDLVAGTTTLVSRASGPAGAGADAGSFFPAISGEGRFVAFASDADNLSPDAGTGLRNVFRRDVLGPPPSPPPPPAVITGAPPTPVALRCAGQRATIVGTARRDVIRGTRRRDVIAALAGNDLVRGLGGNDLICLGAGADRALGGPGADRILGGPGRDVLLGGPGRDRLLGQAGRDRALGGAGRDICPAEVRAGC